MIYTCFYVYTPGFIIAPYKETRVKLAQKFTLCDFVHIHIHVHCYFTRFFVEKYELMLFSFINYIPKLIITLLIDLLVNVIY